MVMTVKVGNKEFKMEVVGETKRFVKVSPGSFEDSEAPVVGTLYVDKDFFKSEAGK